MRRPTTLEACAAVGALVLGVALAGGPAMPADALVATCQGQDATVVGPTDGVDTTGTDGDDVIVAPLSLGTSVYGLGGSDTICLVDGPLGTGRTVTVLAGSGNDSVVNQSILPGLGTLQVELGAGADHYVGSDFGENVYGSSPDPGTPDTEVDVIDTRGGMDTITSGTQLAGTENHDLISSGAGVDDVRYASAAGERIDDGGDRDRLTFTVAWAGPLTVDDARQSATVGDRTALTWTGVGWFTVRVDPGSPLSFAGSDADEYLSVSGTVADTDARGAAIRSGAGDDSIRLENYLPSLVDTGEGLDTLAYDGCYRATIRLAEAADCTTADGRLVSTLLAGIESLSASVTGSVMVWGTPGPDDIAARSRHVGVVSGSGPDYVRATGSYSARVVGGAGADHLKGATLLRLDRSGATVLGGRGDDVLRGGDGSDLLVGKAGHDVAHGNKGEDRCLAEVRVGCEHP